MVAAMRRTHVPFARAIFQHGLHNSSKVNGVLDLLSDELILSMGQRGNAFRRAVAAPANEKPLATAKEQRALAAPANEKRLVTPKEKAIAAPANMGDSDESEASVKYVPPPAITIRCPGYNYMLSPPPADASDTDAETPTLIRCCSCHTYIPPRAAAL